MAKATRKHTAVVLPRPTSRAATLGPDDLASPASARMGVEADGPGDLEGLTLTELAEHEPPALPAQPTARRGTSSPLAFFSNTSVGTAAVDDRASGIRLP